jgi:hypothetical protein
MRDATRVAADAADELIRMVKFAGTSVAKAGGAHQADKL